MRTVLSRRKVLALSAAAGGAALVPFGATGQGTAAAPLVAWTGVSLGAAATIRVSHPDRRAGQQLLGRAVAEARRLETILSLYRDDTALAELNRRGVLVAPPAELVELLRLCDRIWHDTGGAFDPTVQPLWRCYAEHFSVSGADPAGPAPRRLREALEMVGWPKVRVSRHRIGFARRGMALTLNGIAQGYITDRVVGILRNEGIDSSLVDMGEIRTLGRHPEGRPWQAEIAGPVASAPRRTLDLVDKAVATTGADGFRFTADGHCNHLFNPGTGRCARPMTSLTVVAPTAAVADALSTAFAFMDDEAIGGVLSRAPGTQLYVNAPSG